MKEYFENDNMNENLNNENHQAAPADPAGEPVQPEEKAADQAVQNTAEPTDDPQTSAPQDPEQPAQNTAYSAPQTNGSTYAYSRKDIPENTYRPAQPGSGWQQNTGYTPNPNYTYGQNPANGYGQPGGQHQQQYQQQTPYQNGYTHPQTDNSQIYYTPVKPKKKKNGGKKVLAAVAVCAGLLLSAGFGFLGASLALSYTTFTESSNNTNNVTDTKTPMVVFKNVDDVTTSTSENGGNLTTAQVAAIVKDSVVEINTEYTTVSSWFQYVMPGSGAGSGVILSADGYIITNNHVICGSDGVTIAETIIVRLTNGEEYKAEVIGADGDSDIAILKIEAEGLTPAVCTDSDKLAVGEDVVVVGNPLGELGGSVTNGIISALDREIDVNGVTMNLMQTNAAVNPGNSGGGIFNMRGELVGIVNAKSSGENVEGLGFAIPINDALTVSEQLLEYGYVRGKIMIGIETTTFTDLATARFYGLNNVGVYVIGLVEGYNDDVLSVGDRIISINGSEVNSGDEIAAIVKSSAVGDVLNFQISRKGKIMEVQVTCYEEVPDGLNNVQFEEN
ncbi:MAG: trypsin-like peptidase domain-containing protein [Clostridia bacterium]|nr:trypsin-like peptidase domain-containing protein [Clostridia bacterium]